MYATVMLFSLGPMEIILSDAGMLWSLSVHRGLTLFFLILLRWTADEVEFVPVCKRWRSNPSGKFSQQRLTRGAVTSTMRRAAHPSGCARRGAAAGCSAMTDRFMKCVSI